MRFKLKRSFIIGAMIAAQVGLLCWGLWELGNRSASLYPIAGVFDIVAVLYILAGRDHPAYKLAWTTVILGIPLFGLLIYFIAGTQYLSHATRKRLESSQETGRLLTPQASATLAARGAAGPDAARQSEYIRRVSGRPAYTNTQARLLTPGERMLEALLEALGSAERFILMEYFIISDGVMWKQVFEILARKAAEGVEVRIIYDDLGSLDHLPGRFQRDIEAAGIRLCRFNPFLPVISKFMNYRDHRKITVVDGDIAITGGINIGDEYINVAHPHGEWKDTSILLRGDAAWSFTVMFLEMWHVVTGERLPPGNYRPLRAHEGEGFAQPFDDSPVDGEPIAECVYLQVINAARRYVYITTPYLILDNEMQTALCVAAQSGVDVRIVTPFKPDKWYVHTVTRSNYGRLLEAGVRIYEFLPGFLHAKTCVSDDETGVVGSVNFDYRSFYQQFECAVWLRGCPVLGDIRTDFLETLARSQEITLSMWAKRSRLSRLAQALLHILAPMM